MLTVLFNVLLMIVYMSFGFVLCKTKKGDVTHAKTLSSLLVYVCGPMMIINSFLQMEYTQETLLDIGIFFIVSLLIQILFFLILYIILKKKYEEPKYRILTVSSVLGNVGFFGLPIITGLYPNDPIVSCYSSMYVMSMNLLVFTIGVFLITNDKKFISVKSAILNPTTISILISLPLFIFKVDFPDFIDSSINVLAKMVTPICMIVLGMRLTTVKFKSLVTRPFVYIACFMKLVAFPLFAYLCVYFLPLSDIFKATIFILSAAPSAAIILSMAEIHECEQELSANVVLLATILSVLTLPPLILIL